MEFLETLENVKEWNHATTLFPPDLAGLAIPTPIPESPKKKDVKKRPRGRQPKRVSKGKQLRADESDSLEESVTTRWQRPTLRLVRVELPRGASKESEIFDLQSFFNQQLA